MSATPFDLKRVRPLGGPSKDAMRPMTAKARLAVIGTGWWATYTHIPALQAHPSAELVALCDSNPDKRQAAAKAYGVRKVYTSAGAMLDQEVLDGVVIATPHATHAALAHDCLTRGLHVLLEKPMTLQAADAQRLVALARAQGRELIMATPGTTRRRRCGRARSCARAHSGRCNT